MSVEGPKTFRCLIIDDEPSLRKTLRLTLESMGHRVTEAATGSGQVLTGKAGNKNTDGLSIRSSLGTTGSANVTVNQGLASRLNAVLSKYLDATTGRLATITKGYQASIDDFSKSIDKQNDLFGVYLIEDIDSGFVEGDPTAPPDTGQVHTSGNWIFEMVAEALGNPLPKVKYPDR